MLCGGHPDSDVQSWNPEKPGENVEERFKYIVFDAKLRFPLTDSLHSAIGAKLNWRTI